MKRGVKEMAPKDRVTILTGGFESIGSEVARPSVTIICERDGEEMIRLGCEDLASVQSVRSDMRGSGFDTTEIDSRWPEIEEALG
jgi:hypothetical protein